MKNIKDGCWEYVPTKEYEITQNKRVYKKYFLGDFVGYVVKIPTYQYKNGKERKVGLHFATCKKEYIDEEGKKHFIIC